AGLGDAAIEIAEIPSLKIGKLVVGRQEGMRLTVALRLGGLVKTLPTSALFGVVAIELLAEGFDDRKHSAVAEVAVVGDGEHAAAGLALVGFHPLPQLDGIIAAERRRDRERLDLHRLVTAVAEDDIAMEVVASRVRGPLKADEGREAAGVIVVLRRGDGFMPGTSIGPRPRRIDKRLGERPLREGDNNLDGRICTPARLDHLVPLAPGGIGEELRLAREQIREEAHVIGMIGDDEEIERTGKLRGLAA